MCLTSLRVCPGLELSNNLKYNLHIDQTCKKASKVLGFLKRNLKHCPSSVKDRAYTVMVNRHSDEVVDYIMHECYV
jgi:hypothetical protein